MKNVLLKFAGLFVERIPVDEHGQAIPPAPTSATAPRPGQPGVAPSHPQQGAAGQHPISAPNVMSPIGAGGLGNPQPSGSTLPVSSAAPVPGQALAVALRAWVPQEYASHLAPHGLHVIAAGGSVTSEQARGWGAGVLIISAECLGQDLHLIQQPQMPTVFITPQPAMIPDTPGLVQVQEPLRASDVAHAAREAVTAWHRAFGTPVR